MNPTGRRVLIAHEGMTHDSLREGFRWEIPERFNLGAACADQQNPAATALVAERRQGIESGDRVAIIVPQSVEVGLSHLALWKLGARFAPPRLPVRSRRHFLPLGGLRRQGGYRPPGQPGQAG